MIDLNFQRLPLSPLKFKNDDNSDPFSDISTLPPFVKQVQQINGIIESHFKYHDYPLIMTVLSPTGGGKSSLINGIKSYIDTKKYTNEILSAWDIPMGDKKDNETELVGTICQIIGEMCINSIKNCNFKTENDNGILKEKEEYCEKMLKSARKLRLGRTEAAQAAIAFSDSPTHYSEVFADQLIPSKSLQDFRSAFASFLDKGNVNINDKALS